MVSPKTKGAKPRRSVPRRSIPIMTRWAFSFLFVFVVVQFCVLQRLVHTETPGRSLVLKASVSKAESSITTDEKEQQEKWPSRIGACHLGGWPSEAVLMSNDTPVRILITEMEKTTNDRLVVLFAALSQSDAAKTGELIQRALPALRCDFRRGHIALNAAFAPLVRSRVAMNVLAEDKDRGFLMGKLECDLPPFSTVNTTTSGKTTLPTLKDVRGMNEAKRHEAETSEWLHWQLSLPLNQVETSQGDSTVAPSLPLCNVTVPPTNHAPRFYDRTGPTADEYEARGNDDTTSTLAASEVTAALCVTPSMQTPSLHAWASTSIRDWIYYQQQVVGFSRVFYLDPFGEELLSLQPEIEALFRDFFLHVPHTSKYRSVAEMIQDGPVADALAMERCFMLARQYNAEYFLRVSDPMDLVLPMKRQRFFPVKALAEATSGTCVKTVHMQAVLWSARDEDTESECDEDWCNTVDTASDLFSGSPVGVLNSSELAFSYSGAEDHCKASATLPRDAVQIMTFQSSSEGPVDKSASFQYFDVAVWVQHLVKTNAMFFERQLSKDNGKWASLSWMPVSTNFESSNQMKIRMCRPPCDTGPLYGEAVLLTPAIHSNSSAMEAKLHLTFFDASVVSGPNGQLALSISLYAEDKESRSFSLHNDSAWGVLHQSNNTQLLLPKVDCVFAHFDHVERLLVGDLEEWRTPARWKSTSDLLLWLECPLPEFLPVPNEFGMSSTVFIDANVDRPNELHMIRPIQLCTGAEESGPPAFDDSHDRLERVCDGVSVACKVGCIDDMKKEDDRQARCCSRCHEHNNPYHRFDERDYWTPEMALHAQEEHNQASGHHSGPGHPVNALGNRDLSICLRPFYLETECSDCDGMSPLSAQRLIEWIEYHILIGFDVIYILDRHGDSLLPILRDYRQSGRVLHIPFDLLTDLSTSREARSGNSRFVAKAHDQVLANEYCLSIARRRDDAFTALIDLDEFVRYPEAQAGALRRVVSTILQEQWSPKDNRTALPDSILLDRYDVEVPPEGLALKNTLRMKEARTYLGGRKHGKVLAQPHALTYGIVPVHNACNAGGCGSTVDGTNSLVPSPPDLSILHFRRGDKNVFVEGSFDGEKVQDLSLRWAYKILSAQFIGTVGWKAASALSRQGLLRLGGSSSQNQPDQRPGLFVGILTYCSNRDRRDAIRQSWLSLTVLERLEPLIRIQWRFVLGRTPSTENHASCNPKSLNQESRDYGDLLLLDDLQESYNVLTRKSLAIFKWADANVDPDFVFKTDDDSYVNLPSLAFDLAQIELPPLPIYGGSLNRGVEIRLSTNYDKAGNGRWYTKPEDFPVDTQAYPVGAGYLLSRPLVHYLATITTTESGGLEQVPWGPEDRMGWIEDGAVGYLLRGVANRAVRVHLLAWDLWYSMECQSDFEYTIVHHITASQQIEMHQILYSDTGYRADTCSQMSQYRIDMPKTTREGRIKRTAWGGSILDQSLSPLLTMAPPPFDAFQADAVARPLKIPVDRDVIVVTGGLHNIGRHLLENVQMGYTRMSGPITVLVLDSAQVPKGPTGQPLFSSSVAGVTITVEKIDITNYKAVLGTLSQHASRIRGIIHLAAVSRVQDCHHNVTRCEEVNVGGTKNILRAMYTLYSNSGASKSKLPWLIFASSREVYGGMGRHDVANETSTLQPLNIYGETKLRAEIAIRFWTRKTGFNAVVLRFTNVYGSCHDHGSRLVPNMISGLFSDKKFSYFGTSDKTISLLHVLDAVQSILLAVGYATTLNNAGYCEVFNVGGGPAHDVFNIKDVHRVIRSSVAAVHPFCKYCKAKPAVVTDTSGRSVEPEHFRSSIEKAFRVLGYNPSRSFNEETVRSFIETCEWSGSPSKTTQKRLRADAK